MTDSGIIVCEHEKTVELDMILEVFRLLDEKHTAVRLFLFIVNVQKR